MSCLAGCLEWRIPLYHVSVILSVSQELKEQFTAYRREKGENEAIIAEQMETLRQEASALKMDNVKVTAKVCISVQLPKVAF